MFYSRFFLTAIAIVFTNTLSEACISGRGKELRSVLRAEHVFFGNLLEAKDVTRLEDGYYEQVLVFQIGNTFVGDLVEGETKEVTFQTWFDPRKNEPDSSAGIEVGKRYAVVVNKQWKRSERTTKTSEDSSGAPERSTLVHRSRKFACGGDALRLTKSTHPHARAIWMVFTGHRYTPDTRADVLTEFLGINGRF